MTTRKTMPLVAAVLMILWASHEAGANQEKLASAKSLYESASYEAALTELSAIDSAELVDTVETYKALCLLGLGRVRDAESALQVVVARKPLMVLSDAEYSPRVVALFRDVRKKALPAAAQQLYSLARTDYENKKYEAAAAGFKQTLLVLADVAPDAQTATLADLKELSTGFLELANTKIAAPAQTPTQAAAPPSAPPQIRSAGASAPATGTSNSTAPAAGSTPAPVTRAAAAPAAATPAAASAVVPRNAARFYTLADKDVTPPVQIEQEIPRWTFSANLPARAFTGTLELLIDEKGLVESATLADTVWPQYDAVLIQAAKRWRYTPAVKDGSPVKFKRVLVLNIDPRAQRGQ